MHSGTTADFDLLTRSGVYGFFDSCEVTSIFLSGGGRIHNYLTIGVFGEYCSYADFDLPERLTRSLLPITNHLKLGICRFYLSVADTRAALCGLLTDGRWPHGGGELTVSSPTRPLRKQFVPMNSDLTSVLKGNDTNGSYVIELFDEKKEMTGRLSEQEKQRISAEILNHVPVHLDVLPERAGNVLFQFPSRLLACHVRGTKEWDGVVVSVVWDPRLGGGGRGFRVEADSTIDGALMGRGATQIAPREKGPFDLRLGCSHGQVATTISEPTSGLVYFASSGTFVHGVDVSMNVGVADAEPRRIGQVDGYAEVPLFGLRIPTPECQQR